MCSTNFAKKLVSVILNMILFGTALLFYLDAYSLIYSENPGSIIEGLGYSLMGTFYIFIGYDLGLKDLIVSFK